MEHKTLQTRKRMYVPAAVCSYARSWAGRRGKRREGRKGTGRRSAIDFRIAGRSLNHYLFHLSEMCLSTVGTMTHGCISIMNMTKSTHLCGCRGNFVNIKQVLQKDEKHCVIAEGTLLCWLLSPNLGIQCYNPYKLPVVSCDWTQSVLFFITAFPDVCKIGGTKFSLRVYSEKNTLGAPSCSYRKQTGWLPLPPLSFPSTSHCPWFVSMY